MWCDHIESEYILDGFGFPEKCHFSHSRRAAAFRRIFHSESHESEIAAAYCFSKDFVGNEQNVRHRSARITRQIFFCSRYVSSLTAFAYQ